MNRSELFKKLEDTVGYKDACILMQNHFDACLDNLSEEEIIEELDRLGDPDWVHNMVEGGK